MGAEDTVLNLLPFGYVPSINLQNITNIIWILDKEKVAAITHQVIRLVSVWM